MKYLTIIWLFFSVGVFAQKQVRGRVVRDTIPLSGAHVMNLYTNAVTTTDANGYFTLKASERNPLQITFVGMQTVYHTLTKVDFGFGGVLIQMKEQVNQLDEVEVSKYQGVSAQRLGILQHTPVERTFAEKRLYSATHSAGGNLLSIDLLINTISGRKKLLKKIVANEQNLAVANYIRENMKVFLQKELKLNEEEIDVLAYYVMERTEFHDLVRKKENKQMEFMLIEAWGEYQRLAKAEK